MNIQEALESGHTKKITNQIILYVGRDKERFNELILIFFGKDKKLQQRAAWPLGYLAEGNPRLIEPHLNQLIHMLEKQDNHPAVARCILRIFQEYDMPDTYHGELIDLCFRFILNPSTPIAIRAYAITTAANIAAPYPELKREMLLVLNELSQEDQRPALRVRLKNAFKTLRA
ncbi:MAG: HEAT repeat domain-containing protein [Bacteroidia bacterium]|jgi:hypothetical protein|nr:HEAT repeat domain-containing protein [Bacteroidia bacterium]